MVSFTIGANPCSRLYRCNGYETAHESCWQLFGENSRQRFAALSGDLLRHGHFHIGWWPNYVSKNCLQGETSSIVFTKNVSINLDSACRHIPCHEASQWHPHLDRVSGELFWVHIWPSQENHTRVPSSRRLRDQQQPSCFGYHGPLTAEPAKESNRLPRFRGQSMRSVFANGVEKIKEIGENK